MYSFQTSTREGQLIKELPVFLLPFMNPPLFLISLQPARYVLEVVKKIRSRYVTICKPSLGYKDYKLSSTILRLKCFCSQIGKKTNRFIGHRTPLCVQSLLNNLISCFIVH